jgi:hypothetical protein
MLGKDLAFKLLNTDRERVAIWQYDNMVIFISIWLGGSPDQSLIPTVVALLGSRLMHQAITLRRHGVK